MSVVIDASVLVAALIDIGPEGKWAEQVLAQGRLHAPELARVETVNILRRLELAKRITQAEATAACDEFMQLACDLHPFEPFADRVWALRYTVTCYDGWYIAIAETLELPLATLDRRLAKSRGVKCRLLLPDEN